MAADIQQVLRILSYRGIAVRVRDGRLIARPTGGRADALVFDGQWYRAEPESGPIPDDMIQFIRQFRDRLVAYLLEEERLAETVTNILALSDEERDEYRRLIVGNHPEVTPHDREAWLRAQAQIEIDQEIAA